MLHQQALQFVPVTEAVRAVVSGIFPFLAQPDLDDRVPRGFHGRPQLQGTHGIAADERLAARGRGSAIRAIIGIAEQDVYVVGCDAQFFGCAGCEYAR